jgi:hypothetical protein
MDPLIVGLIGIAILIILLFSGLSIGMGMALVGFVGFAVIVGMRLFRGRQRFKPRDRCYPRGCRLA